MKATNATKSMAIAFVSTGSLQISHLLDSERRQREQLYARTMFHCCFCHNDYDDH